MNKQIIIKASLVIAKVFVAIVLVAGATFFISPPQGKAHFIGSILSVRWHPAIRWMVSPLCGFSTWYSDPTTGKPLIDPAQILHNCPQSFPVPTYGTKENQNVPAKKATPSATPKQNAGNGSLPNGGVINFNRGYLISRTFCINSVLGNPPDCNTMNGGHMMVRNGFLSGDDPTLTGNVGNDGAFVGKYNDQQGVSFDVVGQFSLIAQFKLRKQPVLPDSQGGVNITWTFQKQ